MAPFPRTATPGGGTVRRPVAVVVDSLTSAQLALIQGIESVLSEHGIATVVVVAHPRDDGTGAALADLVQPDTLRGAIVTATGAAAVDRVKRVVTLLAELPLVTVGVEVPGAGSVRADGATAIRELMQHLISARPLRDVVLLRGSADDPDSRERERAVREVLGRAGAPLQDDLVLDADFDRSVAARELTGLLTDRREIDAVVALDDQMAFGALDALAERGLRVPDDVVVTGFGDDPDARSTRPPLTTVDQRRREQGVRAARMLLERLEGVPTRPRMLVAGRLVVRRSCGELSGSGGAEGPFGSRPPRTATAGDRLEQAASGRGGQDVVQLGDDLETGIEGLGAAPMDLAPGWVRRWAQLAWSSVAGQADPDPFLGHALPLLWRSAEGQDEAALRWWAEAADQVVVALLQQAGDAGQQIRAARLHGRLTSRIAEVRHEAWLDTRRRDLATLDHALELNSRLAGCDTLEELARAVVAEAPGLGVRRMFLSLFEARDHAPTSKARLVLAYRDRSVDDSLVGTVFPSARLLPSALTEEFTRGAMVVQPLAVGGRRHGFLVYDRTETTLAGEALRRDLAAALDAMSRRRELRERRDELQALVVARTRRLKMEMVSALGRTGPAATTDAAVTTDPLTGLADRTAFDLHLARQWNRMRSEGRPLAALVVDLDLFDEFNRRFGEADGDAALRLVARAASSAARRPGDLAARFGGERFALLLPGAPEQGAGEVARRLHALVREAAVPYPGGVLGDVLTVSIGVAALVPDLAQEPADLLEAALGALHLAKGLGRDRWIVHDSGAPDAGEGPEESSEPERSTPREPSAPQERSASPERSGGTPGVPGPRPATPSPSTGASRSDAPHT
jgi:diguanylate cyclase (GGDEF)-like protein